MYNIYYQNVRGLRTKTSYLYRNVVLNSYDIICLKETWLLEGISNSELFDDRYIVFRRDRDYEKTGETMGGGVLIAVRREIIAESRGEWWSNAEDLWVTLTLHCRRPRVAYKLHVCAVYICDENTGNTMMKQLETFSDNMSDIVVKNPCDKFLIMGDFNMPNLTWKVSDGNSFYIADCLQGPVQQNLFDDLNLCNLSQYNNIFNCNNRLLDLIFSNNDVTIARCQNPLSKLDATHHPALCISADFVQLHQLKPRPFTKYLYHSGDYDVIISKLDAIDWQHELHGKSLEDAVSFFYSTLNDLRTNHIPSKTVTPMQKYPPWFKKPLIKVLKQKYKFHKKYKTYGNCSDLQSFVLLRDRAKLLEKELLTSTYLALN